MTHPLWPLFDLRIRTPRLELRPATDEDLAGLCAVAAAGIHPPDEMPFAVAWTDTPPADFARQFAQYHWLQRANWRRDAWTLNLAVVFEGTKIGVQGVEASDFAVLRTVRTGSWLGRAYQGRGIGRESRAAVLAFAFDGLGAEVAESAAFVDNTASNAVSRGLGYEENGLFRMAPRGIARDAVRFRLTRAAWAARERPPVVIEGLEACRSWFGLTDD